jgi:hypothetical protein
MSNESVERSMGGRREPGVPHGWAAGVGYDDGDTAPLHRGSASQRVMNGHVNMNKGKADGVRRPNLNQLSVTVAVSDAARLQIRGLRKRLASVMFRAPDFGAESATRAYAVLRPFEIRLRSAESDTLDLNMTYEGAKALAREAEAYLTRHKDAALLVQLHADIINAIKEREKVARGPKRHRPQSVREQRGVGRPASVGDPAARDHAGAARRAGRDS